MSNFRKYIHNPAFPFIRISTGNVEATDFSKFVCVCTAADIIEEGAESVVDLLARFAIGLFTITLLCG